MITSCLILAAVATAVFSCLVVLLLPRFLARYLIPWLVHTLARIADPTLPTHKLPTVSVSRIDAFALPLLLRGVEVSVEGFPLPALVSTTRHRAFVATTATSGAASSDARSSSDASGSPRAELGADHAGQWWAALLASVASPGLLLAPPVTVGPAVSPTLALTVTVGRVGLAAAVGPALRAAAAAAAAAVSHSLYTKLFARSKSGSANASSDDSTASAPVSVSSAAVMAAALSVVCDGVAVRVLLRDAPTRGALTVTPYKVIPPLSTSPALTPAVAMPALQPPRQRAAAAGAESAQSKRRSFLAKYQAVKAAAVATAAATASTASNDNGANPNVGTSAAAAKSESTPVEVSWLQPMVVTTLAEGSATASPSAATAAHSITTQAVVASTASPKGAVASAATVGVPFAERYPRLFAAAIAAACVGAAATARAVAVALTHLTVRVGVDCVTVGNTRAAVRVSNLAATVAFTATELSDSRKTAPARNDDAASALMRVVWSGVRGLQEGLAGSQLTVTLGTVIDASADSAGVDSAAAATGTGGLAVSVLGHPAQYQARFAELLAPALAVRAGGSDDDDDCSHSQALPESVVPAWDAPAAAPPLLSATLQSVVVTVSTTAPGSDRVHLVPAAATASSSATASIGPTALWRGLGLVDSVAVTVGPVTVSGDVDMLPSLVMTVGADLADSAMAVVAACVAHNHTACMLSKLTAASSDACGGASAANVAAAGAAVVDNRANAGDDEQDLALYNASAAEPTVLPMLCLAFLPTVALTVANITAKLRSRHTGATLDEFRLVNTLKALTQNPAPLDLPSPSDTTTTDVERVDAFGSGSVAMRVSEEVFSVSLGPLTVSLAPDANGLAQQLSELTMSHNTSNVNANIVAVPELWLGAVPPSATITALKSAASSIRVQMNTALSVALAGLAISVSRPQDSAELTQSLLSLGELTVLVAIETPLTVTPHFYDSNDSGSNIPNDKLFVVESSALSQQQWFQMTSAAICNTNNKINNNQGNHCNNNGTDRAATAAFPSTLVTVCGSFTAAPGADLAVDIQIRPQLWG